MQNSPKMRAGLTRTNSSLDIITGSEEVKLLDESIVGAESERTGEYDSPSAAEARQSSCYHPSTITKEKSDNAAEGLRLSCDNTPAEENTQKPSNKGDTGRSEPEPDAESDDTSEDNGSFAKTFHRGIHRAYNTSCRELNALFGEIQLDDLSSQTKRAVTQCMLLHLLAISTDDPATYRGSIRRALEICQTITDGIIAESMWKRTWHITHEMDEDFFRRSRAPSTKEPEYVGPKPLDTITEEDDAALDSQTSPFSSVTPPRIDSDEQPGAAHHEFTRMSEVGPAEDPAEATFIELIAELRADALQRKEATDNYIVSLDMDAMHRRQATEQYMADLAADVAERRRATEQYLANSGMRIREQE